MAIAPIYEPQFSPELRPEPPAQRGIAAKMSLWWRHRKFLWHVFWISAVLSSIVAVIIPKKYKSTARMVAPETASAALMSGLVNKAGAASSLGLDPSALLGLKTPGAFYMAVLQSRTVQDRLVEKWDLRYHYHVKYGQDARKRLNNSTDVEEDKKSNVIKLTVTDWDASFAAMLARSYIEEMNRVAADLNTSAAHREKEFLEQRLQSARQDLDEASRQLSEFSSKHTMMDVQEQSRSMMDSVARVQGELIASQSELRGLEQIYSEDNVRVRSLRARVGELQAQLKRLMGTYTPTSRINDSTTGADYPSIRTLPALGYRYQDLYRQAKIQETIFEFLTQQYEMTRVEEAKELPVVRVMDEPDVPEKKSSPIRSLIVASSVFAALLLGCWWIVEKEKWGRLPAHDSRRLLVAEVSGDLRAAWNRVRGSQANAKITTETQSMQDLQHRGNEEVEVEERRRGKANQG